MMGVGAKRALGLYRSCAPRHITAPFQGIVVKREHCLVGVAIHATERVGNDAIGDRLAVLESNQAGRLRRNAKYKCQS